MASGELRVARGEEEEDDEDRMSRMERMGGVLCG